VKLIGAGVAVAVVVGLLGLAEGSFLRALHFDVFGVAITTALFFDVGVYLAVVGVILAAVSRLGVEEKEPPPLRRVGSTAVDGPAPRSTPTTDEPHHPSTAPMDLSSIRVLDRSSGRPSGASAERTDRPRGDDS
jgi:multicomponent Na+:H+ antiporter subunit A